MSDNRLLTTGIVGTILAAVCCFTPLLIIVFGAAAIAGLWWLDILLFCALGLFGALAVYALVRKMRRVDGRQSAGG
jgi:mercuric ion transport protein